VERLALLASRSTGPEIFGFEHCGRTAPASRIATEVSKMAFLKTAGAGRTIANYYFEKVNFPRLSTIHISNTGLKRTV